jgi:hypothetical protein
MLTSGASEVIDFAECGVTQCGQRFLDSSAPRLIRHATFGRTVGRESTFLPAGKDQKLSRSARQSLAMPASPQRLPRRAQRAEQPAPSLRPLSFYGVHPCREPKQNQFPARIQAFLAASLPTPLRELQRPSRILYTAVGGDLAGASARFLRSRAGAEVHQGGAERGSSRPCLTAGNSRHRDEVLGRRNDR